MSFVVATGSIRSNQRTGVKKERAVNLASPCVFGGLSLSTISLSSFSPSPPFAPWVPQVDTSCPFLDQVSPSLGIIQDNLNVYYLRD